MNMSKRLFISTFLVLAMFLSVLSVAGTNLVSMSTTVNQNDMTYNSFSIKDNETVTVNFNVTSGGPVDLLMMNSGNFSTYQSEFSVGGPANFTYIPSGTRLSVGNITYTTDLTAGNYDIVVENADFTAGGAITTGVDTFTLSLTAVPTPTPPTTTTTSTSPGFELPIFLVSIATVFIFAKKTRKTK